MARHDPIELIERRLAEMKTGASNGVSLNAREALWLLGLIEKYRGELQGLYDQEEDAGVADAIWNALQFNPEKI